MFSDDDIELFNVIIETLKVHNTAQVSDLTHTFRLWKDARNSDIITKEKLQLDEYEYDELESFFYYLQATKYAKEIAEFPDVAVEETVPDEMLRLQFETMDRAE
ncbi:hypothetical protein [Methanogenium cariaci]|uniref:hypothetical protein n=1 Tax=Methanogenium cariaci TaxID=2197 RepID=UPI000780E1DE|nr:hypothetical protein [Methanogenium cariaci]